MHEHRVQCPQILIPVSILFKMSIGQIMAISRPWINRTNQVCTDRDSCLWGRDWG